MRTYRRRNRFSAPDAWIADSANLPFVEISRRGKVLQLNRPAQKLFDINSPITEEKYISEKFARPEVFKSLIDFPDNYETTEIEIFSDYRICVFNLIVKQLKSNRLFLLFLPSEKNSENEFEFFKQYALNTLDAFALWTIDNQFLFVGNQFERIFQRSRNELDKNPYSVYKWVHPEDREKLTSISHKQVDSPDGKFEAEFRIFLPDGSYKWVWYRRLSIFNNKGEIYRYLSLISDINQRKRAELELTQSKQMLQLVLDTIPARVFWKDLGLNFLGCNKLFLQDARLTSLDQIIGKSDYDMVWSKTADIFRNDDRKVIESGIPKLKYEEAQELGDGSKTFLTTSKVPLCDSEGQIIGILGTYEDITQRKEVEKQLTLTKRAIDSNKSPIFWVDNKGSIIYFNSAFEKILGYTSEQISHLKIYDLFEDKINKSNWKQHWEELKKVELSVAEKNIKLFNGSLLPVEISANYFTSDDQEYLFAYLNDISERKNAEKLIENRHAFERLLFNISARFIDLPVDLVDSNIDRALEEICKFSGSDSAHIFIFENNYATISLKHFYSNVDFDGFYENIKQFPVDKNSWHFKTISSRTPVNVCNISTFDNNDLLRTLYESNHIASFVDVGLFYQNDLIGFFGLSSCSRTKAWQDDEVKMIQIVGDIFMNAVARKNSYNQLIESEQTYREIYNAANDAIIIHDASTAEIVDVNKAMLDMYELTFDEALKTPLIDLLANKELVSSEKVLQDFVIGALLEPKTREWLSIAKSGKKFWAEVSVKRAEIYGKTRIMAIIRNIDERKKTEELLRSNEEKYRMIVEGQGELIIKVDREFRFLFVSPSFCKLFDTSEEKLLATSDFPETHEEDREASALAIENLFRPPFSCYIEQRSKTKKGWRWLAWNYTAVLDEANTPKEIIGVGRDITYQKMVESALRESEEQFRSIVQNLSDIVFLLNEEAIIKYVTPSCERYLGYNVEELLGKKLTDLVHDDDKRLAEENIRQHAMGSEYNISYEVRIKHLLLSWRTFEVKSQNMLNHPVLKSIIYTISDITERKLMEKQVLEAIIKTEEKERERFAKDLHDDLGPLLSSIKMYVGMLGKTSDAAKQEFILKNLNEIVRESIATTKDVSNDLNPHVLNNYGLVSALELFIEKVSSEIAINFEQNIENARFAPTIELSLYRISKELINNTLKHSGASKIYLKIFEKKGRLNLYYEDNGQGLQDSALRLKKPGGMGLSNIISRAKSLNATFNFHTNLPDGFKFDLSTPLLQE